MSDQGKLKLNFLLLFFGVWFVDFLMCEQGIHSPYHWFYGSIQTAIYYGCLFVYYATLTAIAFGAIALSIWLASKLFEIYHSLRTPVQGDLAKENRVVNFPPPYS